jgi:predicted O-linked N-acetylglucosamine transferase (SPINDLY family)
MPTKVERLLVEAARAFEQTDYERAIALVDELSALDNCNPKALNVKALALYFSGSYEESLECMERYLEAVPDDVEALYNAAMIHRALGNLSDSFKLHQQVVKRDPDHVNSLINLGQYFGRAGRFKEALVCFQRAMQVCPTDAAIVNNCAGVYKEMGLVGEAIRLYLYALQLQPNMESAASNICYMSQFVPDVTLAQLQKRHAWWAEKFAEPQRSLWIEHTNDRDPDRVLKVGFISEDFRRHTVGRYLLSVFENLPSDIHKVCYYLRAESDDITASYRAAAEEFIDAKRMSASELYDRIIEDEIDVLFDLSGHTSGNRLRVLTMRAAPVQMSWLGYVGTTGIEAIDYKIASTASVPHGSDRYFAERILRFPPQYPHQCFTPPGEIEIGPLPYTKNGYITFGTMSTPTKLNRQLLVTWAEILRRVPDSKLLLKSGTLASPELQGRVLETMKVDAHRVLFEGFTPHPESLSTYNKIDIVLDPWPFSGCTTTCEALWMGVPVITRPGATEAGRHTLSYLNSLGVTDTIAQSFKQYVDIACDYAKNIRRLQTLRETLRQTLLDSPVCDAVGFAKELARLIRYAWQNWCVRENHHVEHS